MSTLVVIAIALKSLRGSELPFVLNAAERGHILKYSPRYLTLSWLLSCLKPGASSLGG